MTKEMKQLAQETFNKFNENERFGCQFGMFPAAKTPILDKEGTRLLAVALMKLANGETL